jgi:hypothetical protein
MQRGILSVESTGSDIVERLGDGALVGRWLRLSRPIRGEDARTGESANLEEGRYLFVLSHVHSDGKRVAFGLKATWLIQDIDLLGSILIDGVPAVNE